MTPINYGGTLISAEHPPDRFEGFCHLLPVRLEGSCCTVLFALRYASTPSVQEPFGRLCNFITCQEPATISVPQADTQTYTLNPEPGTQNQTSNRGPQNSARKSRHPKVGSRLNPINSQTSYPKFANLRPYFCHTSPNPVPSQAHRKPNRFENMRVLFIEGIYTLIACCEMSAEFNSDNFDPRPDAQL